MKSSDAHERILKSILESVKNAKRVYRDQGADAILRQPELMPYLVESLYSKQKKESIRSAWVLELVCLYEVRLIFPWLEAFTSRLVSLEHESAIRPVSKICSLICEFHEKNPEETMTAYALWKDDIVEASFEWLTRDHKIAPQVFAMESLYILGKDSDWIHDELFNLLDKDFAQRSSGYQSRARKTMDKIAKVNRKKY